MLLIQISIFACRYPSLLQLQSLLNPVKLTYPDLVREFVIGGVLTFSNLATVSYMVMLLTLPYWTTKSIFSPASGTLVESGDVVDVASEASPAAATAAPAASSSPVARSVGALLDCSALLVGAVQARLMLVFATDVACTSSGGPGILFVPGKRKTRARQREREKEGDVMRSAFHNASLIGQYWFCLPFCGLSQSNGQIL